MGSYNFTAALSNGEATRSASAQLNIGDFNATLSTNSLSVAVGQTGNVTIKVTGQNDFTDSVTLTCGGAPIGASCAISPNAVNPSSNGTAATMTVTVNTMPSLQISRDSKTGRIIPFAPISISAILLGGFAILSLAPRKGRGLGTCLMLLVILGFRASCGGGGGGGGGGGTSFSLTVQASADGVVKNAGTVIVTVP